jgi:hypothetical protein
VAATFISMLQVQGIPRPPPSSSTSGQLQFFLHSLDAPGCYLLSSALTPQTANPAHQESPKTLIPRVQDAKEVTSSNECGLIKRLSAVYEGSGGSVRSFWGLARLFSVCMRNFPGARGLGFWRLRANVLMFCVLAGRIHLFGGCRRE